MFKLTEEIRFKWPVVVKSPSQSEPGKIDEQTLIGHFRALTPTEEKVFLEEMRSSTTADEITACQQRQIAEVLEGWDDVTDEAGDEVPFGPFTLDRANRWPWFREAIVVAYGEAMSGRARLGN